LRFLSRSSDTDSHDLTASLVRGAARLRLTFAGIYGELVGGWRLAADWRSFRRFAIDALAYRAARVVPVRGGARRRTVSFKDGTELTYRLNRGDVRAIAEVWMVGTYDLPFAIRASNIVDLGANIGAASVWLARRHGCSKLVAVEPVPDNAELARINLARAGIDAEVLTAAVGKAPGIARFVMSHDSTWGRLGPTGIEVALITPQAVIDHFPPSERIELVKIDIEGAEQELFAGDLAWLERVDCLVIELHGDRVDWRGIIARLTELGFSHRRVSEDDMYAAPTDLTVAFQRTPRESGAGLGPATS
jgi:FkbM family methyltransferase